MSRIQDIMSKAERDGTARRTRALADEAVRPPIAVRPYPPRATAGRPRPDAPAGPGPARSPRRFWSRRRGSRPRPARSASRRRAAPHSLAAEQYCLAPHRIARAENGRAIRAIVVTSPAKGDGKTLTAANLALTMAQEFQHRVLLVDADLRRPSLQQLFGFPGGPGLADVLAGAADTGDALVTIPDSHLTVMPAGTPPHHPAELLGSASMRRALDTLRSRFDRILIDMPPAAPLADVQIVAPMADGVLLIVRAGITPKPAIERALGGLDQSKVLGLVLNESGRTGDAQAYVGYGYIAG